MTFEWNSFVDTYAPLVAQLSLGEFIAMSTYLQLICNWMCALSMQAGSLHTLQWGNFISNRCEPFSWCVGHGCRRIGHWNRYLFINTAQRYLSLIDCWITIIMGSKQLSVCRKFCIWTCAPDEKIGQKVHKLDRLHPDRVHGCAVHNHSVRCTGFSMNFHQFFGPRIARIGGAVTIYIINWPWKFKANSIHENWNETVAAWSACPWVFRTPFDFVLRTLASHAKQPAIVAIHKVEYRLFLRWCFSQSLAFEWLSMRQRILELCVLH